jgi:exopolysaccharide production protein ExoZ
MRRSATPAVAAGIVLRTGPASWRGLPGSAKPRRTHRAQQQDLMTLPSQPERTAPIEALRAVAALAVAAFHFQLDLARALPQTHLPDLIRGAAGVDVFFVISGFVIARSAAAATPDHGAGHFAARRLIRIVPLYWSVTLLYLVLAAMLPDRGNTFTLPMVLASFAFIPYPRADGFMQPVIGQGWSLNYEMLFYAIYAVAIAMSRRHASWIAIGALVEFWTSSIMLEFAAGIVLAELYARGWRLSRRLALAGVAAAVAFFLFAPIPPTEFNAGRVLWLGLPSLLLVASLALTDRPLIPVWRWVILLGAASYAMYLLHSLPNRAVIAVMFRLGLDAGNMLVFTTTLAVALAGTVALSVIVYTFFERPVMRRLQKKLAIIATR